MDSYDTQPDDESLERSCTRSSGSWITTSGPIGGIELLQAWFTGRAYEDHRHDTYAIGLTDSGVQVFDYRGAVQRRTPGQIVALYPDELHNGRAGTEEGFGYRIIYVEPVLLAEAIQVLCGRAYRLPFLSETVSTNPTLAQAIHEAFQSPLEGLSIDSLVLDLAEGLLAEERRRPLASRRVDRTAVERARQFLDVERTRVVHSTELESLTGLTRYELARQFKLMFGTSPYRYLLMRRLDIARQAIYDQCPLAEVAYAAGFSDQAHFTRMFKATFGLTPARYRALRTPTT